MGKDLMKQKLYKKLKVRAAAIAAGLIISAAALTALFILSETYISKLDKEINAQLDIAFEAVEKEDFIKARECGREINEALKAAEANLKLFINHRDITELMKYADNTVKINIHGGEDAYNAYISDFIGIRCLIGFLKDNNSFSPAGVL